MAELRFPVSTREISEWLPHRGGAIWVDQINWVRRTPGGDDLEGQCRIFLDPERNYADQNGSVRPSSYVEWMAQSFGYVGACRAMEDARDVGPRKAFLVQVKDFEVLGAPLASLTRASGDWVDVHVKQTHRLGPVILIDGEARAKDGRPLARAKLKLFAE